MPTKRLPQYLTAGAVKNATATITAGASVDAAVGVLRQPTAAITAGASVVAILTKGTLRLPTATITAGASVAATRSVNHLRTAAVTAGASVTGTNTRFRSRTAVVTAGASVVAALKTFHSPSAAITAGASVSAVLSKGTIKAVTAAITAGAAVVASVTRVKARTAVITAGAAVVANVSLNGAALTWLPAFSADLVTAFNPLWFHGATLHTYTMFIKVLSGTIKTRLYNMTDGAPVAGSEMTLSLTGAAVESETPTLSFPLSQKNYRAEVAKVSGGTGVSYRARLVHKGV